MPTLLDVAGRFLDDDDTEAKRAERNRKLVPKESKTKQQKVTDQRSITTSDAAFSALPTLGVPKDTLEDAVNRAIKKDLTGYTPPRVRPVSNKAETKEVLAGKKKTLLDAFEESQDAFKLNADEPRAEGWWDRLRASAREKDIAIKKGAGEAKKEILKGIGPVGRQVVELGEDVLSSTPVQKLATILSADEHTITAGINKALGRPDKPQFSDNTWTSLLLDSGVDDTVFTRSLGLGMSILLSPSTYLTFGAGGALKLGKGLNLTKKGMKLRNELTKELASTRIAQESAKLKAPLKRESQNAIRSQAAKDVDNELREIAAGHKKTVDAVEKGRAVGDNVFDLGGIKFAGRSVVTGDELAKISKDLGKYLEPLAKTDIGQAAAMNYKQIKDTLGKVFIPHYGVERQMLNAWEDTERLARARKLKDQRRMEAYFTGLNKTQRHDFSESNIQASMVPHKIEVKSLAGDPIVQDRLDRFHSQGRFKGRKGLAEKMAQWSGLVEDKRLANWFPGIDARLDDINLKLPKELGPAQREFLKTRQLADKSALYTRDPVRALSYRATQIAYANMQDKLWERITKEGIGGVTTLDKIPLNMRENYVPIRRPFGKDLLEEGKSLGDRGSDVQYWAPKHIADQYNSLIRDSTPRFWPAVTYPTQLFKAGVTSVHPAFHTRNFGNNIVLNSYNIGRLALSPALHKTALDMVRGRNLDRVFKSGIGEELTLRELKREAQEGGVITGKFQDIAGETMDKTAQPIWQRMISRANPLSLDFAPYMWGRKLGTAIEEQARLVNYAAHRQRGLSPKLAAIEAMEALFDYGKLTNHEQYAKLMIPFYTFSRKNLGKHLQVLSQEPGKLANQMKFFREMQPTEEDWEGLPEYAKRQFVAKMKGMFFSGFGLPLEDIIGLASPALSGDPENFKEMLTRFNPVLRYPAEKVMGLDFFSGRELESINAANEFAALIKLIENPNTPAVVRDGLKPVQRFLRLKRDPSNPEKITGDPDKIHILRSMPSSRFQSYLGLLNKEDLDGVQKALRWLTGVITLPKDEDLQLSIEKQKTLKKAKKVVQKAGIARPISVPYFYTSDKPVQKELNSLIDQLLKQSTSKRDLRESLKEIEETTEDIEKGEIQ